MPEPRLHLDADTSIRSLHQALLGRGHDVTRTPNAWVRQDASDREQLLGATSQERCIFTFNIRDFVLLAGTYAQHGGVILAAQESMGLSTLISALDCLLSTTEAADWPGQIRWLSDWRGGQA